MASKILLINGYPQVGKDAFCHFLKQAAQPLHVYKYSTIDPVRDMLSAQGIPIFEKTLAQRKLLAEVGAALYAWRLEKTQNYIDILSRLYVASPFKPLFVIMVREPEFIEQIYTEYSPNCLRILIKRKNSNQEFSNAADANVERGTYDCVIHNEGSLQDLQKIAQKFLSDLNVGALKNEYSFVESCKN